MDWPMRFLAGTLICDFGHSNCAGYAIQTDLDAAGGADLCLINTAGIGEPDELVAGVDDARELNIGRD